MKYTHYLLLLFGLLASSTVSAQDETFSSGGFDCRVTATDAVEITGASSSVEGILVIPATVENGGIVYTVTSIAAEAFKDAAITELDLSAATGLQHIGESAFAECKQLKSVVFPALESSSLAEIGALAFHHDTALSSMNLQDTRIEVLESLFTKDMNDEMSFDDLTELVLPQTLKEIKSYALQFLGLRSITIPASVTAFGEGVLEGTIYLEEFYWKGAQVTRLPRNTFLGEDALKTVYFLTTQDIDPDGLTDMHFYMCHKDRLNVYVTQQSYYILVANGYSDANSVYSTLVADTEWVDGIRSVRTEDGDGSAMFNLQGQQAGASYKGIVVRKGKKYVQK